MERAAGANLDAARFAPPTVTHGSSLLNVLIDPSKMLRERVSDVEEIESTQPVDDEDSVPEIEVCIGSKPATENRTPTRASLMTPHDEEVAKRLCRRINPRKWHEIFESMVDALLVAQHEHEQRWRARDAQLSPDWHQSPWYCIDPRFFSTPDTSRISRLDDTATALPYVRDLGFDNILLLQHYETDWLTGGQGVVSYETSKVLGGEDAFVTFMRRSHELGQRVVTAAAINHTSIHHAWFRQAVRGNAKFRGYYHDVTGMQRLGEVVTGGQVLVHYHDAEGRRSVRRFLEPEFVPHDHLVTANAGDSPRTFYSSIRPYQVDLELRNPKVLGEIFRLLGREVAQGVLGKYVDAVAYWIKKPGTNGYGLDDTHSLLALLKMFLRLVGDREVVLPSVVGETASAVRYCGRETEIHRVPASSQGDAFMWTKGAIALKEALYLQDRRALEAAVRELPRLPRPCVPIAYLENQDEIPLELASSKQKAKALTEHIRKHGGGISRNGLAAGCRHADCLNHDPARIAMSIFCLYMLPATPMVYFGTEIGAKNNVAHARLMRKWRHEYYQRMGHELPEAACHDPSALQRGALPADQFRRAVAAEYPALTVLRKLNHLWKTSASMRSREVHLLEHSHPGILAWIKRSPEEEDRPLLLLANLTEQATEVRLPALALEGLTSARGSRVDRLVDVLAADALIGPSECRLQSDKVVLTMTPFGYRALAMAT
ncbi:MAG: hypothetical protein H6729_16090 [Deltaproteobacteria bacterium]|nr:hypothetical protein [Deltaproteobacteria bacterium]